MAMNPKTIKYKAYSHEREKVQAIGLLCFTERAPLPRRSPGYGNP